MHVVVLESSNFNQKAERITTYHFMSFKQYPRMFERNNLILLTVYYKQKRLDFTYIL